LAEADSKLSLARFLVGPTIVGGGGRDLNLSQKVHAGDRETEEELSMQETFSSSTSHI
jgi:hypothetical protein